VLIASDGSESTRLVAATAHRLFGSRAEYLLLTVVADEKWAIAPLDPGAAYALYTPSVTESLQHAHEEAVEEAQAELQVMADRSGLRDAEAIVQSGPTSSEILRVAHEHHVDVVVVGSRHVGWFSRLLHGSVSDSIVHATDVPTLVVPVQDDDEQRLLDTRES
jgi:nucleotide-binding universal stress UspA family protein